MVELTESAQKQLEGYFQDKEPSAIRIYLASGGWAGSKLSLALDEPHDDDESFEAGGFTFVVEKNLFSQTGNLKVDMTYYGFAVDSVNPVGGGGGCSSAGSCSTTGSCGCG